MRFLNDVLTEFMTEKPQMTGSYTKSIVESRGSRDSRRPLFTGAEGAVGE